MEGHKLIHTPVADVIDLESGGRDVPYATPVHEGTVVQRSEFVRTVYRILTVQLLVTAAIVSPFVLSTSVRATVDRNPWMVGVALVVGFGTMLSLVCFRPRNVGVAWTMLGIHTVAEGIVMGVVSAHYTTESVFVAILMTAVVTTTLTVYAWRTKTDLRGMGAYLFVAFVSFLLFWIVSMLFQSRIVQWLYCAFGVLLFSVYLIYDTQWIVSGGQYALGDEALGALSLYQDILRLFVFLLRLLR